MFVPLWLIPLIVLASFCLGFLAKKFLPDLNEPPPTKSQELIDFFKDIDIKGYSLIRVDPDSVFHVSGRDR